MPVGIAPTTKFGQILIASMDAQHFSVREVAQRTQTSYEHIRKIIHGKAFPSKYLLGALCEMLQLNLAEMERALVGERIKRKFGVVLNDHAGNDSELRAVEVYWQLLIPAQKEKILATMEDFVQAKGAEEET